MAAENSCTVTQGKDGQANLIRVNNQERKEGNEVMYESLLLEDEKPKTEIERQSLKKKEYYCKKCLNLFNVEEEIMRQHTTVCLGERQAYECKKCNFQSSSEFGALQHYLPDGSCDGQVHKKIVPSLALEQKNSEREKDKTVMDEGKGKKLEYKRAEIEEVTVKNERTETIVNETTANEKERTTHDTTEGEQNNIKKEQAKNEKAVKEEKRKAVNNEKVSVKDEGIERNVREKTAKEEEIATVSEKNNAKKEQTERVKPGTSKGKAEVARANQKLDYSKIIKKHCKTCNVEVEGGVRTANAEMCPRNCGKSLVHMCQKCNMKFDKYVNAKFHVSTECYGIRYKCEYPYCEFTSKIQSCYLRHKRKEHNKK